MFSLIEKAHLLGDPSKLLEIHPLRLESLLADSPPFILWAAKELSRKPQAFSERWGALIAHKALSLAADAGFPIKGPFFNQSFAVCEKLPFNMGLFDLAAKLSQILDAKVLRAIQAALSTEEQHFLKKIFSNKGVVIFEKFDFTQEKLEREALREAICLQGMRRMARALPNDQKVAFAWKLPPKIGDKLLTMHFKNPTPEVAEKLRQELTFAIGEIKS